MVLVLLQPGLCLLLGPASNANASPWEAGAESPSIIKEDSSLHAEKMRATEWDREKSVRQTCGNSGGVREHPRRKWGGKRGESGWGREVRGRSHPHTCRQTDKTFFFLFHSAVVSQPRLTELHPALPAAHYPGPIITPLQQDTCYVTRMKIVTTGKKNKGSIIYKYIHTTVQKFGVSDSFLL